MFMQLTEPLVAGESRTATLAFARNGTVEIELSIAQMGARAPH
jgi:copper(I)-binding protein